MNWQALKNITHVGIGRFLALMIVAWSPFMGGPRLPSLLLAIMGAWLIATRRQQLFDSRAMRRWFWVFALLWLPALLSVPTSFVWQHSAGIAAVLLLYFLAGIALIHVLRTDQGRAWLMKWVTIVLALWVVDGVIQYVAGKDLLLLPLTDDGRVVGFFGTNLRLSLFLAVLLPVFVMRTVRFSLWWAIVLCIASVILVMLAGSRGVLVMAVMAAVTVAWRRFGRYRWPVVAAVVLIATGLVTLAPTPMLKERVARTSPPKEFNFETINHLLSDRLYIWESAGRMVLDRPLTGVGIGAFADAYDTYSKRPLDMFRHGSPNDQGTGVYHAHQMYVSVVAETGMVGLAGLIAVYVLCATWYFRAPRERRAMAWPLAFGLFVATFPINSQPVLFTHWWFPLMLLLLCGTLAALGDDKVSDTSKAVRAARTAA